MAQRANGLGVGCKAHVRALAYSVHGAVADPTEISPNAVLQACSEHIVWSRGKGRESEGVTCAHTSIGGTERQKERHYR